MIEVKGYVPGVSSEAYFALYADKEGYITLPDTKLFCKPKEDVRFNRELTFVEDGAYNCIWKENNTLVSVYCTDRNYFLGMINLTKEQFDQYFTPFEEES